MSDINLDDYVLESKAELDSLANVIKEKSGAEGPLSVEQMTEQAATLYPTSTLAGLIDRSITEIEIPSGITLIGSNSFRNCQTLKSVKIPEGVTKINTYAFHECKALANVDLPVGLQSLGSYAFSLCSALKKIKLPHGLKSIAFAAFQNTKLEEVELPSTLEKIEQYVFFGTNLTSITLPNSITSINQSTFNESKKLTAIYCDWERGEKPEVEALSPWGASNVIDIEYSMSTITTSVNVPVPGPHYFYTPNGYPEVIMIKPWGANYADEVTASVHFSALGYGTLWTEDGSGAWGTDESETGLGEPLYGYGWNGETEQLMFNSAGTYIMWAQDAEGNVYGKTRIIVT